MNVYQILKNSLSKIIGGIKWFIVCIYKVIKWSINKLYSFMKWTVSKLVRLTGPFFLLFFGIFRKYEKLEDIDRIEELYKLLVMNDYDTRRKLYFLTPRSSRLIYFMSFILMTLGFIVTIAVYEVDYRISLTVLTFTINMGIRVYQIAEEQFKDRIKHQIDYKKYLEQESE